MHKIDFKFGCACGFTKAALQPFIDAGYFRQSVALIDLQSDYQELIGGHKNNIRREIAKAEKHGFHVKPFHPRSYITDLVAINTSKEVRSGGKMKPHYLASVEDWGGQPKTRGGPAPPACPQHTNVTLGCFSPAGGYWGDGAVVAYLTLNILGNFANYSSILGHGDYLKQGVMQLLHAKALEYLSANGFTRYVVYYLFDNPPGLADWKRRAGFREHSIFFEDSAP